MLKFRPLRNVGLLNDSAKLLGQKKAKGSIYMELQFCTDIPIREGKVGLMSGSDGRN